jgi:hypothetical protein
MFALMASSLLGLTFLLFTKSETKLKDYSSRKNCVFLEKAFFAK